MKPIGSGQDARATVARASCPPPHITTASLHFLPARNGGLARPQNDFLTIIHSGLHRAFSAALICGFCAVAMAAEIHDAVRAGDAAAVARLLKKSPKLVNLADDDHAATPLYHAVDVGNLEIVRVLLQAGAKVNVKTADGMTPVLRAAAIANDEEVVGLTKVSLSFVNSSPGRARTASREALKAYQKSLISGPEEEAARLAILRLLVERGGSVLDSLPPTGLTPLHQAVNFPNSKAVEYLLGKGADPEASTLGMRPLHNAALGGNAEVVKILLAHKVDVNAAQAPPGIGTRPLHYAVINGDMEIIRLLLDHGADVNGVDKNGAPALHVATWNDEIFNLLLERGANPKLQQSDGTTTLHKACQEGSSALVEKLLLLHPELEGWDGSYFTPLLNAAEAGRVDLLKLLVAAGTNPKATQQDGRNALHLAARSASLEAVQFLLDQKLGVNALSDLDETALMRAADAGRLETMKLLLRAGASVHGADRNDQKTALMGAAFALGKRQPGLSHGDRNVWNQGSAADYLKIVALLLDAGADVQARDGEEKTALHWAAAACGNQEVLELLIAKGAQVDAKDKSGQTPLHKAAYNADVQTVAALLEKGANLSARDTSALKAQPIHIAAQGNNVEVIGLLLEKGADVTATESHGGTPLHLAAFEGKLEAARFLLEHDAPPAALDQYKYSPLHFAATAGQVGIVRLLLDRRVPVNGADAQGNTPLHNAVCVRAERRDFQQTMPGQSADDLKGTIDIVNKSNAADKLTIVRLLLANGAKPQIKNRIGNTPVDLAEQLGTPAILAALKSQASSPPGK